MDPSCWGEFGDALDGRVGEPREDGAEVLAHRDLEPAAAFNHRQDGGHARPACSLPMCIQFLRPIATGCMEFSARLFRKFQLRMIEEAGQLLPQR